MSVRKTKSSTTPTGYTQVVGIILSKDQPKESLLNKIGDDYDIKNIKYIGEKEYNIFFNLFSSINSLNLKILCKPSKIHPTCLPKKHVADFFLLIWALG